MIIRNVKDTKKADNIGDIGDTGDVREAKNIKNTKNKEISRNNNKIANKKYQEDGKIGNDEISDGRS